MAKFDPMEERAVEMLDDIQLEAARMETVADEDERFEVVLWNLCLRGVAVIERVCRTHGEARGLSEQEVEIAIEDASARMLLRLSRVDPQPQIHALAAEIAAECVEHIKPLDREAPRLASRSPELRLVGDINEAIGNGQIRANDWRSS
jgi:hypothetical protein